MRSIFLFLAVMASSASASIFLPGTSTAKSLADIGNRPSLSTDTAFHRRRQLDRAIQKQRSNGDNSASLKHPLAMAIPGDVMFAQVAVGGFANFIAIYNTVITARILLSWFPQAQGVAILQPVFAITDPYLNLFRGIIPPIFGLDLSPILAFVTLDLFKSSTATLAAEIPEEMKEKLLKSKGAFGVAMKKGQMKLGDI